MSHNISNVNQISLKVNDSRNDEVLELETIDNTKTLLVFEQLTEIVTD